MLSFFNHSCAPNLFNCSSSGKKVCITIRPIKKGEQLFICYKKDLPTRERQEILLGKWGFLCKCGKCYPHCELSDRIKMRSDSIYESLQRSVPNMDYSDEIKCNIMADECMQFLRKYGHLPWSEEIEFVQRIYTNCLMKSDST